MPTSARSSLPSPWKVSPCAGETASSYPLHFRGVLNVWVAEGSSSYCASPVLEQAVALLTPCIVTCTPSWLRVECFIPVHSRPYSNVPTHPGCQTSPLVRIPGRDWKFIDEENKMKYKKYKREQTGTNKKMCGIKVAPKMRPRRGVGKSLVHRNWLKHRKKYAKRHKKESITKRK